MWTWSVNTTQGAQGILAPRFGKIQQCGEKSSSYSVQQPFLEFELKKKKMQNKQAGSFARESFSHIVLNLQTHNQKVLLWKAKYSFEQICLAKKV